MSSDNQQPFEETLQKQSLTKEKITDRINSAKDISELESIIDDLKKDFKAEAFDQNQVLAQEIKNLLVQKREEIIEKQLAQQRQSNSPQQEDSATTIFGNPKEDEEEKKKAVEDQNATLSFLNKISEALGLSTPDFLTDDVNENKQEDFVEPETIFELENTDEEDQTENRYTLPNDQNSEALELYDEAFAAKQIRDSQAVVEYDAEFAKEREQESAPQGYYYEDQIENRDLFSEEGKIRKNESFLSIAGLKKDATAEEARKAYLQISRKYHPDKNLDRSEAAKLITQDINQAYARYKDFLENSIPDVETNKEAKDEKLMIKEFAEEFAEVGKKVVEAIKIDPARTKAFQDFQNIFQGFDEAKSSAEKLSSLNDFLNSEESKELANKDTSFGIFRDIASQVIAKDDCSEEDRLQFLEKLTENFSYLGEKIDDVKTEQEEPQKIFNVYLQICQDKQFGDIVTNKFQDVFSDAISAPIFEELIKLEKEAELPEKEVEKEEVQEQSQKSEPKTEKESKEKKKEGVVKNFLENLTIKDKAVIGSSVAAFIALSVALPGVGTVIGLALLAGASTMISKSEKINEKESSQNQNHTGDNVDRAIADFVEKNKFEIDATKQNLQNSEKDLEELTKNSEEKEISNDQVNEQEIADEEPVEEETEVIGPDDVVEEEVNPENPTSDETPVTNNEIDNKDLDEVVDLDDIEIELPSEQHNKAAKDKVLKELIEKMRENGSSTGDGVDNQNLPDNSTKNNQNEI